MRKYLISLLIICPLALWSQEEPLDRDQWTDLKTEVDYTKAKQEPKEKPREEQNNDDGKAKNLSPEEGGSGGLFNLGPILQTVIVVLFIVFIAALLYALLSNVSFRKETEVSSGSTGILHQIEEHFTKSNLEKWLEHALKQRNYYLALRIYFLMALKDLENQQLIRWKKDKTNWHYIQELKNHHLQTPFVEMVYEFDKVWYGEKNYSDEELRSKMDQFKSFRDLIGRDR